MRVILGMLRPDAGTVRLFGDRAVSRACRGRIGYLGDENGLYPHFNAEEMMQLTGELFRLDPGALAERRRRLLRDAALEDHARVKIKKFSKGMRQRLAIALALLGDPELLILDEPYSGLDPVGRRQIRQLLLSLKKRGKTILLSSHIVPDVEAVCDRVGILRDGCIRKCLALDAIFEEKSSNVQVTVSSVAPEAFDDVQDVQIVYHHDRAVVLRCRRSDSVKTVVSKTYDLGGEVLEVKPLKFNLEDYLFEALTDGQGGEGDTLSSVREETYAHTR